MTNDFDDECATPIDVLLQEHAGGAKPPDLSARVAAGFAAGGAARAAARLRWQRDTERSPLPRRLAIAAVVVLGLGVVGGARWLDRDGAASKGSQQSREPVQLQVTDPHRTDQHPAGELRFELRVVDPHGGPVQAFALDVYQTVGSEPALRFGRVDGVVTRHVVPRDFAGEHMVVDGLPAGRFVAVVSADAHARTASSPFTLAAGTPAPRIVITLQTGGEARGVVHGSDGKPLAGALVRIAAPPPGGLSPASGVDRSRLLDERDVRVEPDGTWSMRVATPAAAGLPPAANRTRLLDERDVRTGADGTWSMRHLAHGTYRVQIEHPDHCEGAVDGVVVANAPRNVGIVPLARGARLTGRALDASGRGVAGVAVTVQRLDADDGRAAAQRAWSTTSGEDGEFALPHALPAGRYRIGSLRQTAFGKNRLDLVREVQRLQRTFEIAAGATTITQDVEVAGL